MISHASTVFPDARDNPSNRVGDELSANAFEVSKQSSAISPAYGEANESQAAKRFSDVFAVA
ncbi:TPA: hypothetical protein ACXN3I_005408 [Pseudomonas aeruginosa]